MLKRLNGGDKMASITIQISITRTVSVLNSATMQETFDWVKTNVTDKIPTTCTINTTYNATP